MKPETLNRIKLASAKAFFFTFFMLLMNALFAYNDNEIEKVFKLKFYFFGVILFIVMFLINYFTDSKNPTWSDVLNKFKRKK
jgi:FtsH-binding integral membrane protein